jgi:hypothetical protein
VAVGEFDGGPRDFLSVVADGLAIDARQSLNLSLAGPVRSSIWIVTRRCGFKTFNLDAPRGKRAQRNNLFNALTFQAYWISNQML